MVEINHTVELTEAQETIHQLRDQLHAAQNELKMTNSELMQLTLEMDDRVSQRTHDLEEINQQLLHEIEERKQAQNNLAYSEELFHKYFELGRVGMAMTSVEKGWLNVNGYLCQMLGYSKDKLMQMTWAEITHPEDLEPDLQQYNRMLAGEFDSYSMDKRFICKDKEVIYTYISVSCVRKKDGSVDYVIAHLQDITDRTKAEKALQESEKRFKRAVLDAPFPILIHAENGEILVVSNTWTEITGYTLEEIPTIFDWTEKAYGKQKEIVKQGIDCLYRVEEKGKEGEFSIQTKFGERRIWDFSSSPLGTLPDGRRIVMSMAMDVTERNRFEEQLKIYAEDLKRSNKELEQFAYVASHDLQEPLRKISSFTELFVKRYPDLVDEKAQKYVAYILDGAKRMQILIQDLLMYSRVGRMDVEFQEVNLDELIEKIKQDISKAMEEKKAELIVHSLPVVTINLTGIYQVFQNLIKNAIKFNKSERPQVTVLAKRKENEWLFCVEDNGIGIELEYQERIFVIFQRLHPREEYSGTGIGLSVCKKIVEQRGGLMWIESEIGKGSKLFFTIPDLKDTAIKQEGKVNE